MFSVNFEHPEVLGRLSSTSLYEMISYSKTVHNFQRLGNHKNDANRSFAPNWGWKPSPWSWCSLPFSGLLQPRTSGWKICHIIIRGWNPSLEKRPWSSFAKCGQANLFAMHGNWWSPTVLDTPSPYHHRMTECRLKRWPGPFLQPLSSVPEVHAHAPEGSSAEDREEAFP